MLTLSIVPLLNARGIKHKTPYLQSRGFKYHTARYIVGGNMSNFNLSTVEKICLQLECTPNDLLFYTPSDEGVAANHPLRTLNKERYDDELTEGLKLLNTLELDTMKQQLRILLEKKNEENT